MYNEIVRKDNFPLQDEAYVVGEKDGRYFFAWGSVANQEEMPSEDILDGANGIEWFDTESEAIRSFESAVEAAEVSKGDE